MEAKCIATTQLTRDAIALYMIADKYKISFLSLLALYEIYERDVFIFFYIMSRSKEDSFIGLSPEDIEFSKEEIEFPKESNLKLILSKAKKIADALRRHSSDGLTSSTLPWYNSLEPYCVRSKENPSEITVDFYAFQGRKKQSKKEMVSA